LAYIRHRLIAHSIVFDEPSVDRRLERSVNTLFSLMQRHKSVAPSYRDQAITAGFAKDLVAWLPKSGHLLLAISCAGLL
jgi:hypothetical protein